LNTGSLCSIRIAKGKGSNGAKTVDVQQSRCINKAKLSIATAAKYTASSPCTNIPLECPLCRQGSDAVWKYNLLSHIERVHPTVNAIIYKALYALDESESKELKERYTTKPRITKKKQVMGIKISEAHSSRLAMRYLIISLVSVVL
jgi:hypothetical protein